MRSPKDWMCPSWSLDSDPVKYYELYHTILLTCITNGILILPTIALNGIIIITIVKTRTLHCASNWFLGNLMLTDMLMGVFAQPLYIVTKDWSLKGLLRNNCEVGITERFFAKTLPLTLMLTLTASSLDRYLAIRLMLQYRTKMTSIRAILIIACLWVFAVICGCLGISVRYSGFILFLAIIFLVCLVVTFIAYFKAFHGLRRHQNQVSVVADNLTCINVKKYQRSFTTMLCVFLLQLVFYTPDICANFVSAWDYQQSTPSLRAVLVADTIVYINAALNPVLFLWRMRDVRRACKRTLNKMLRR